MPIGVLIVSDLKMSFRRNGHSGLRASCDGVKVRGDVVTLLWVSWLNH